MSIKMKIRRRMESDEYPDHVYVECEQKVFRDHPVGGKPEPVPERSGTMAVLVPREDDIITAPLGTEITVRIEVEKPKF